MSKERQELGRFGEERAVEFLKRNGYRIMIRNYRTPFGEIDIIARDKDVVCFVEVKTRQSEIYGLPQEAVHFQKQRHMARAALKYLKENALLDEAARFDVVAVVSGETPPRIELIKNAFEFEER